MTDAPDEPFTAWISRDALNIGVYDVEAYYRQDQGIMARIQDGRYWQIYHHGEWHKSKESALVQAEKMRAVRIASHEKALTNLRAMQF